ncbi:hypothetical protein FB45DRAFT_1108929 [Roridomyces roridus]|uniref:DUF7779 domain-containing protein n=1 Tax=Roridomyces roridus TaxID=1738132 RepID=A0AAD7BA25_9AGAR|nr:hypothetical protein FB45DRAFT_1108929 [Roridomyces roridus]
MPSKNPSSTVPKRRHWGTKLLSEGASNWVGPALLTAKAMECAGEFVPFPYIKSAFGAVVLLLEMVEQVRKNRRDLKDLCEDIQRVMKIIKHEVEAHGPTAATEFKGLCEEFEKCLQDIIKTVAALTEKHQGLYGHAREIFNFHNITDQISEYQTQINKFREDFVFRASLRIGFHLPHGRQMSVGEGASEYHKVAHACPAPSRIFHGRQEILNGIHKFFTTDLKKQHICLLRGLGGSGKTQIALKYIEQSSVQFSDIFFIDASSHDTIGTSLENVAIVRNAGATQQDALIWLKNNQERWLLFFDNADDPKIDLDQYFPQCNHGNILITSRNLGLRVYADHHSHVSDMEEPEAVALLLRSAAEEATPENALMAANIVKALWYLPLAITQAGAFIAASGSLHSYLKLHAENQSQLLKRKPDQSHSAYERTVHTTLQLSFDQLSQAAQILLQLCSFIHHSGISEDIFKSASEFLLNSHNCFETQHHGSISVLAQFTRPTGIWTSLRFSEITAELQACSLITMEPKIGKFSIHPLVHSWSQSTVDDPIKWHSHMVDLVGMAITHIPEEDLQSACQYWLPHLNKLGLDTASEWSARYGRAYQLFGKFTKAEELQMMALQNSIKTLTEENPLTLTAMADLAGTYRNLGKFHQAASLQSIVLAKRESILGENHTATLTAMIQLAVTYHDLGMLEKAEGLGRVALEKSKILLGEDDPQTLSALAHLADTYCDLGNYNKAEELGLLVIEKQKKVLGTNHPQTIQAISHLANAYKELCKFEKAQELDFMVLTKRKEILGEDHPDTLEAMGNLAGTYRDLGMNVQAEEMELQVVEKMEKLLGRGHPETLTAMANLAATYCNLGKLVEAAELELEVLNAQTALLGEDHPNTLIFMANLAATYRELGNFEQAEKLGLVVLAKRRRILGEEHPDTLSAMGHMAATLQNLGKFSEAEGLQELVLEKRKNILGGDHPHTLNGCLNLINTYRSLGKFEKAQELGLVVLARSRDTVGEDHLSILSAMENLATTYYTVSKFHEAAELQFLVVEKRNRILGVHHPQTVRVTGNWIKTRRELGMTV